MAEGKDTWKGLGVPLKGNFEITGRVAATDIMTITGAASQSGDAFVYQTQNGTEKVVIEDGGRLVLSGERLNYASIPTTAPTTGMQLGDIVVYGAGSAYKIALCIDTTGQTLNSVAFGSS